jgi:uncharacterized protein YjiS (DUF1127 family)
LAELDAARLADIGISTAQAQREAGKPFWVGDDRKTPARSRTHSSNRSPTRSGIGLRARFQRAAYRRHLRRLYQRNLAELLPLNDRQLLDIGVHRGDYRARARQAAIVELINHRRGQCRRGRC